MENIAICFLTKRRTLCKVTGLIQICTVEYLIGRFKKAPTWNKEASQSAFTCSKLTIEILEQGLKYVQS